MFYRDMNDDNSCAQYDYPFPDSIPEELLTILEQESENDWSRQEICNEAGFEALSYAWGDHTPRDILYIKDQRGTASTTKIAITSNLSSALHHLRREEESRLLWVDAVCINQGDKIEKSQ